MGNCWEYHRHEVSSRVSSEEDVHGYLEYSRRCMATRTPADLGVSSRVHAKLYRIRPRTTWGRVSFPSAPARSTQANVTQPRENRGRSTAHACAPMGISCA